MERSEKGMLVAGEKLICVFVTFELRCGRKFRTGEFQSGARPIAPRHPSTTSYSVTSSDYISSVAASGSFDRLFSRRCLYRLSIVCYYPSDFIRSNSSFLLIY